MQDLSLYNSAIFSSDGSVLVGRVYKEGEGYKGLLIDEEKGFAYLLGLGNREDIGLYSVKKCGDDYVAVGHWKDRVFVVFYHSVEENIKSFIGPKGILWQTDCHLAVGGYRGKTWHLFLLKVQEVTGKAFSSGEHIYAYSLAKEAKGYVVVGRVGRERNYDGFILTVDDRLRPKRSLRTGWREKDYLRYVEGGWAVGRMEVKGDSEGLLVELGNLSLSLYKRPGFDYFRFIYPEKDLIFGEGEEVIRKALFVAKGKGLLVGDGFSAVRFYNKDSQSAYGYLYVGAYAYALKIRGFPEGSQVSYTIRPLSITWQGLRLYLLKDKLNLKPLSVDFSKVSYLWKRCDDLH
ncbi:MAG: hypothetical protein ACK4OF_04790 [Aquificaceae bacterium]